MDLILTEDPVDHFLAHYGVRGQKWGVRRKFFKKGIPGDFHYRSGKQKAGLIGGAVAGWMVGGTVAQAMLRKFGRKPAVGLLALSAQIGVSVAGTRAARAFMDRHSNDKISSFRQRKRVQTQAVRQVIRSG